MTAKEFYEELGKILKVHPEMEDANVWCEKIRVSSIGLDRRHKPARIKLYE
jgi:hypothetical protein